MPIRLDSLPGAVPFSNTKDPGDCGTCNQFCLVTSEVCCYGISAYQNDSGWVDIASVAGEPYKQNVGMAGLSIRKRASCAHFLPNCRPAGCHRFEYAL
eukprot:scaffold536030_cov12-Prasinocladus_malaysianus.AAC.2